MTELLKIENLWKRYGLKAVIREIKHRDYRRKNRWACWR